MIEPRNRTLCLGFGLLDFRGPHSAATAPSLSPDITSQDSPPLSCVDISLVRPTCIAARATEIDCIHSAAAACDQAHADSEDPAEEGKRLPGPSARLLLPLQQVFLAPTSRLLRGRPAIRHLFCASIDYFVRPLPLPSDGLLCLRLVCIWASCSTRLESFGSCCLAGATLGLFFLVVRTDAPRLRDPMRSRGRSR